QFTNNHAVTTPGFFFPVYGGAIDSVFGQLTVVNTTFVSNMALGGNSVVSSTSNLTGDAFGGAVECYLDGLTDSFTDCTFNDNSARGGSNDSGATGTVRIGDGMGGAIDSFGSAVEVDQSTFTTNVAQGGTTYVNGSSAFDCGEGYGGAIHI